MRIRSALLLAVCLVAVGCSKPSVVGKWVVDESTIPATPGMSGDMAKQFAKSVTLEFKGDKTFNMNMVFAIEGTYEANGSSITMKMTKMMGMDMSKLDSGTNKSNNEPLVATISDDGKSLTLTPPSSGTSASKQPMKFVRAPA